ncbi:MAG: hypothetical protein IK099_06815 [Clostridia bacterium]|nr:hypothetical protein [Clostridia bacterium]
MNTKNEVEITTLIYAGDTVEYMVSILPAGAIACKALNIPKESLAEALPLCKRVAAVNTMFHTGVLDKIAMSSAREASHPLLKLIAKHEPFTFFGVPELDLRLDRAFTADAFKKIRAFNNIVQNEKMNDEVRKKFVPTQDLLALASTMANYYDAITMLQEHISPFAEKLDAENQPRTKEAYLTRFSQSFPRNFLIGDGTASWMSMANVTVQYTAAPAPDNGHMQMQKHMRFLSFGGMLRADFFEGLSVGHAPKRCAICGRWFLTTDARRTKYCGEICIDDPKGRKCRVIGNMNGRDEREKAADHPLIVPYNRRMNTIDQYVRRGTLRKELADAMKKLAKDKKQRALADLAYAKGPYLQEMEQNALKEEAQRLL